MNTRRLFTSSLPLVFLVLGVIVSGCVASSKPPSSARTSITATITISQFADARQVAAAVVSGESMTKLPASVGPQLESLANGGGFGMSLTISKICHPPTTFQSSVNVAACTFGDTHSSRTMVLVGDERAQTWVDVFIQIATAAHVKLVVLAKAACPAALGTFRQVTLQGVPGNSPWLACTAWNKFVLSTIRKLAPQVVVVSSSDNLFLMSGTGYASPPKVGSTFGAFLQALPVGVKRIVIDGFPNPGNTVSPTLCLWENPSAVEKCDYKPTTYQLAYNRALQRTAAQHGAAFINEAAWLCDAGCPALIGGIIPYTIDGFQIQSSYAAYLTGVMWVALEPYLPRPSQPSKQ